MFTKTTTCPDSLLPRPDLATAKEDLDPSHQRVLQYQKRTCGLFGAGAVWTEKSLESHAHDPLDYAQVPT